MATETISRYEPTRWTRISRWALLYALALTPFAASAFVSPVALPFGLALSTAAVVALQYERSDKDARSRDGDRGAVAVSGTETPRPVERRSAGGMASRRFRGE